ncbi:hypothetical protein HELRODRAFT_72335, partial [Helobdella robusta]|uniref:Sodium-coupled monocarboxylate transporter 1 n=1 Tax=Helobdella robusta TaxID=6412 RepID=T1G0Y5_HELRO
SVWPASLSVMASILAAPLILGVPAEIYFYGAQFSYFVLGIMVAIPIFAHLFLSRFYKLEISSIYEYLEYRFSKPVRSLCSAIFALSLIVHIGIITYAPAIVLSEMTAISTQLAVFGVGFIGIVYTTVGGLKGVIWVDAIQMLIILASLLGLIIKGSLNVGGFGEVMRINYQWGRIEGPSFSVIPSERHTVWTQMIGGGMSILALYNNQAIVQKFLGLKSLKHVYITAYISMVVSCLYFSMFVFIGLVIFANYSTCSPFLNGAISFANKDNLVPYFVLSVFQDYPGMAGLFTACVFCASLRFVIHYIKFSLI